MLFFDLFLAAALHLVGRAIFDGFEQRTTVRRRLVKVAFILGSTALVSAAVGQPWSTIWVIGLFSLGIGVHLWWTLSHGIHPVTAEPRAKYYALRGWE